MSSEVGAVFTLTWQPVSSSNGVTQSKAGSVSPRSAYPAQMIRLRASSGSPISLIGVTVELGGIGAAFAGEIEVRQGAVNSILAREVEVEQAIVQSVVALNAEIEEGANVFILVAGRVTGNVRPVLDWRGGLAIGAAFGLIVGLLRRRE